MHFVSLVGMLVFPCMNVLVGHLPSFGDVDRSHLGEDELPVVENPVEGDVGYRVKNG